jgi:hypothetical protein
MVVRPESCELNVSGLVGEGGRDVEVDPGGVMGIIRIEGRGVESEDEPLVGLTAVFVDTAEFPGCVGALRLGEELISVPGMVRVAVCCEAVLELGNESVLIKASSGSVNFLEKDVERLLVVVTDCPVAGAGVPVGVEQSIVVEGEDPFEVGVWEARRTGSGGSELGVCRPGALMGLEDEKLEDVVLDTLAGVLVEVVDEPVNVVVAGVVAGV